MLCADSFLKQMNSSKMDHVLNTIFFFKYIFDWLEAHYDDLQPEKICAQFM
jgi:type I restriction-modification system DNA methylase subunit